MERLDEEIFPLAYLIMFSFNEDRQLKLNDYKFIEKSVEDVCRSSDYRLRAVKIINGRILMVISKRLNPKTKSSSNNNGADIQAFSSKILSKIKVLGKLEKFYCLWKNQQIDSVIDSVKNETENLEFDLPI